MTKARREDADNCRQPTTVVENYLVNDDVRDEFTALIEDIAPHRLAKASHCSIDAARRWLSGERIPNATSLFNMAKSIPKIAMWLAEHGGHGHEAWIIAELRATAMQEGPEAEFARRLLRMAKVSK